MIKVKINLLPKEIRDRRKGEKFIVIGIVALVVTIASLGFAYTYNNMRISDSQKNLADLQAESQRMQASIQSLQVYEQKLAEINGKKAIIDKALTGKIEWSKELEELMIITPNEVSLTKLTGDATGLTFGGLASEASANNADEGHKPVAKWLMRLADTSKKPDVWLTSSDEDDAGRTLKFTNTLKFKAAQAQPVSSSQITPNQAAPNSAGK
jgi:Tfp pilus assembly protein PilN